MRSTLEEKIAARSGRLQLIVAAMSHLANVMEDYHHPDYASLIEGAQERLMELAGDYGPKWLDETSMLLKEMYNRRDGP